MSSFGKKKNKPNFDGLLEAERDPAIDENAGNAHYFEGIVYKKTIGNYHVHGNDRVVPCTLSNRLRKQLIYPTADPHSLRHRVREVKAIEHVDPVAVGDQVRCVDAGDGTGMIVAVLPRRNMLRRKTAVPMPGAHAFEQVFVANIDQVVPVFAAANPVPKWSLLDRYLALSESMELPALVCFTKLDLAQSPDGVVDERLQREVEEYRRIGYPVLLTSVVSGLGLEALRQAFQGKISILLGKSGVGKTTLLNALQPGLGLRVNAVNRMTGKGRHTTTHFEMFPLDFGGAIVDTPGIRELGLWDLDPIELALFFPEMRPYVGKCKFGLDCRHEQEPGCAIRKAVAEGQVGLRRYHSYLAIREGE